MDLGEFGRARAIERAEDVERDWFRFHGEQFTLQDGIGALVTMEFVATVKAAQLAESAAKARVDAARRRFDQSQSPTVRALAQDEMTAAEGAQVSANLDATAAMHTYVRECIGETEWPRFREIAVREKADEDELMEVCAAIVQAVSARPTRRPSASPDGPSSTGDGSTAGSGSPEATPGPARVVLGEVVEMPKTARERQREAFDHLLVPVEGIRSSG